MDRKIQNFSLPPPNYNSKIHSRHGFSKCPSSTQILSYFVIISSIIIYFTCIWPFCPNLPLLILLSLSGLTMVFTSAYCTFLDPTDRLIYYYKWSRYDKKIQFSPDYGQTTFCDACDSYCQLKSKHCKQCNRCVDHFDHHCKWFNNCVGNRTYFAFCLSIASAFIYSLIVTIHIILSNISADYSTQLIPLIISWILAVVMTIFAFLLINLIILHIYLNAKGLTTYEFIQLKKKQEQEIKKEEQNKKQNKLVNQVIQQTKEVPKIDLEIVEEIRKDQDSDQSLANLINLKSIYIRRSQDKQLKQIQNETKDQSFNNNISEKNSEDKESVHEEMKKIQQDPQKKPTKLPPIFLNNRSLKFILSTSLSENMKDNGGHD